MIKAIVVDMDGTLLNDKNQITEPTLTAIKDFQDRGGVFAINTGRSYTSVSKILKETGLICDCLCYTGAAIYDKDGKNIMNDTMTEEEVDIIRDVEKRYGVYVNYLTTAGVLSEASCEVASAHYMDEAKVMAERNGKVFDEAEAKEKYQWILDLADFETDIDKAREEGVLIYKVTIMSLKDGILAQVKEEINKYPALDAVSVLPTNVEVNAARVDKGLATMNYIKLQGILPEETMVIGDSENDIPMFKESFGKTVAMANAAEEIQNMCSHVTKSNCEDGVAHAILTWGLK